jgi:hypothetical protein
MRANRIGTALAAILMWGGLATASAQSMPSGTIVTVRTSSSMSSATAKSGQSWQGTVAKDVVVNGQTVAHSGDPVTGKVTLAKDSGRIHAPGLLTLRLTSVGGMSCSSTARSFKGKSHTKSNAEKIGGGAAAGALIGALAGGGKGAAIGAGAGAGAGTGVAMYTGKQQAVVPAESTLSFTITNAGNAASSSTKLKRRSK